jgi:hypothetical protein
VFTADDVTVATMIFRMIFFSMSAIQLACCIVALFQWLLDAEDPRFEDEKIVYRS